MALKLIGHVVAILPEEAGSSAKGDWVRRTFVIEYGDEYPRKCAITATDEQRVAQVASLQVGQLVWCTVSISSREYEGRWFTDVRLVRFEGVQGGAI